MSLVKNLPTQWWEDWGRKPDKESIDEKPLKLDKEIWEENQKIIKCRYCQWKNLPTWTKDRKKKTEIGQERKNVVWSMKDLDDKGLGQNKVLYISSGVKLPWSTIMQAL